MPPVPMIAGLYFNARAGQRQPPDVTLSEIPLCLEANPWYRQELRVLAGDAASAALLEGFGLQVHRVFDDAPADVHRDAVHKMKHWMCLWAVREFGEFLWLDWDTVALRKPDEAFWDWCRAGRTPKFIRIPNYWATVNCGVYYACAEWAEAMERSFHASVSEPNDELLWRAVLPPDVTERPEFWWGQRALNVWSERGFERLSSETVFAHVRDLSWALPLKARFGASGR